MSGYTWFDVVSGEHQPIPGRVAKVEIPVPDEFIVHRLSRTSRPDSKRVAEAIDTARRRIVYFGPDVFAKARNK